MYSLLTNVTTQFIDHLGVPIVGGKVYTYESGTTNPKVTYTGSDPTSTQNLNPIVLDDAGRANIYLGDGAYRIVVKDKNDALIADVNAISRGVNVTEFENFIQQVNDGLNELALVKQNIDTYVDQAIEAKKDIANGVPSLDANALLSMSRLSFGNATESAAGIAKIATTAQATELTDDTTFLTPLKYKTSAKTLFNAAGTPPMFACRAWVNFSGVPLSGTYSQSGTTVTVTMTAHGMSVGQNVNLSITSGTALSGSYPVATVIDANTFTYTAGTSLTTTGNITRNTFIRGSGNVLGITDNGVGDWTVNFINAMPDANYSIGSTISGSATDTTVLRVASSTVTSDPLLKTNNSVRVYLNAGGGKYDVTDISIHFIR